MKFPQEINGYVFKTKASHLDGGHRLWSGMERDGLRHATLPETHHMKTTFTSLLCTGKMEIIFKSCPPVGCGEGGWLDGLSFFSCTSAAKKHQRDS